MMRPFVLLAVAVSVVAGCSSSNPQSCAEKPEKPEKSGSPESPGVPTVRLGQDQFVERSSALGNRIVCPSEWRGVDRGDTWLLQTPDNQATITILSFTVAGTGSLSQFQEMVVGAIDKEGQFDRSAWVSIKVGEVDATQINLSNGNKSWRIVVLETGECYHALLLECSKMLMDLNGDFYEKVMFTFKGIGKVRVRQ